MPFAHVVSDRAGGRGPGWGFHVRTARRTWFDVAVSAPDRLVVEVALGATSLPRRAVLDELIGHSELWASGGTYRIAEEIVVLLDIKLLLESPQLGTAEFTAAADEGASYALRST